MSDPESSGSVPARLVELVGQWRLYAKQSAEAAQEHRRQGREQSKQFHLGVECGLLQAANELAGHLVRAAVPSPPEGRQRQMREEEDHARGQMTGNTQAVVPHRNDGESGR